MMRAVSIAGPDGVLPEDLVVATPEQVVFRFETAGLGSRFAAQLLDLAVLAGVFIALSIASAVLGGVLRTPIVAGIFIVGAFLSFWAYWILLEALWSGRTLGKYALHLRVIDARGGPVSPGQAVIRNLLRIVDFLPWSYALGTAVMFSTARSQRLGDLAAGTVVIRDRAAVRLADLVAQTTTTPQTANQAPAPMRARTDLEPGLRRFVQAYAQRRASLTPQRREQLAWSVEPALRGVLPGVVSSAGPLAALDQLADRER
jgi:uncharacterized RDD family membrane protein YckC